MTDLLIQNALLVNEGRQFAADLRIRGERIHAIGPALLARAGEKVLSKCGWSPFEGERFDAKVAATFVNGMLAWDGSRVVGRPQGQRLRFAR